MILASGILKGFKSEISSKIFGLWGHIHINTPSLNSVIESKAIQLEQTFYPALDTIAYLEYEEPVSIFGQELKWLRTKRTQGGIQKIYPYVQTAGIIAEEGQLEGIVFKGVDKAYHWEKLKEYLLEGEMIAFNDSVPSRDIIISKITADRLNLTIGDQFQIFFIKGDRENKRRFLVKGIYNTGLEEYDKKLAFIDMKMAQFIADLPPEKVTGFELFVDNIEDLDRINDYVYFDNLPADLYSQTIKQKYPNIFDWLELQNMNEYLILGLLLIICIINMITVLLIMILERTRMIGILKSMGSTNWQVRKIFLYQAAKMILYGLLIGNLIGIGLAWVQKRFKIITLNEEDYYVSYAPIDLDFESVLFINGIVLIVVLFTLLIPSLVIAKISPIKSIRFD